VARSAVAAHIVSRVEKARRLDPSLTIAQASRELGISTSSYYKMRAGTRSGVGSIAARVMNLTRPGGVTNSFNVAFKTGDRVASRNYTIEGARTRADALVVRHNPATRRKIQRQLAAEERATGKHYWKAKEIRGIEVTGVSHVARNERPSYYIRGVR